MANEHPNNGSVEMSVASPVATVTFQHPKGNSLPGSVLRQLAEQIAAAGQRKDVHVVVLRSGGEGPFCAGASFEELSAIRDAKGGKEFFLGFARVMLAMIRCPKPIVTRVQGKVVGGGVGVVAASDYVLATERADLRLSELAVGIGPFVVGPVIEKKIGLAHFEAMALDADWRSATWAHGVGLYAQVHDSVISLDATFGPFVAKLANANPDAAALIKKNAWSGTENWDALLDARAEMSGTLVLSDYTRKAIEAFKAK
jgi:methylglutaconyl-CoA hydratase